MYVYVFVCICTRMMIYYVLVRMLYADDLKLWAREELFAKLYCIVKKCSINSVTSPILVIKGVAQLH